MAAGTTVCLSLDSFAQKPFHQADAQSKLKPNPFSPRFNVITAKVRRFLEQRQRQHKDEERKRNTQIKAVTAAELLLADVCARG